MRENRVWVAAFDVHKTGIGDHSYSWVVAAGNWDAALRKIEERFPGDIVTMISMEYIGVLEIYP